MDTNRKYWNEQQKLLNAALNSKSDQARAAGLFLAQHFMVHPPETDPTCTYYSFESEVWQALPEDGARIIPRGCEHSIVWMMWHSTRCEDITFNILVAGSPQVIIDQDWLAKLNISARDTGNSMTPEEQEEFNAMIDLNELKAYRLAVARRTREIFLGLEPHEYQRKVDPARAGRILDEGAVLPPASYLIDYWISRTIAGLLLMPATRHHLVHINEALEVKKKIRQY